MKILVTGVNGQLGFDVVRELMKRNITSSITEGNTRTNTKDELSVASLQSSGARYEIIATDVVLPDINVFCSGQQVREFASLPISQQQNRKATGFCDCAQKDEHRTPNTEHLSLVTLDITDKQAVKTVLTDNCPEVVVHCAAYTAVDLAEDNEEKCRAVNVEGTRNIAESCKEIGAKMIYISTDYVFSGEGTEPWQADCRDFAPQNVYGKSKLDGEFAVAENLEKFFIVRTAWVFGNHGNNFVKTMLKVGATHDEVRVVNDQIGTPTYTPDLAKLLCDMAESDKYDYYHATNEGGYISWYDFTCEIYRQAGYNTEVTPVTTAEYGLSKAKRPENSRLDKSKLSENGFERLPTWQAALSRYLKGIGGSHE